TGIGLTQSRIGIFFDYILNFSIKKNTKLSLFMDFEFLHSFHALMAKQYNSPSKNSLPKYINNETKSDWIKRMVIEKYIKFINYTEFEDLIFLKTGGSGIVHQAKWKNKEYVAIKQIAIAHDKTTIEMSDHEELIKELKAYHFIDEEGHKNIIKFFGISRVWVGDEEFSLVLEYADLGDLRSYLSRNILTWEQKVDIARHIACGLQFLHNNEILHRDLHPGNVVIKNDNTLKFGIRAIIIDFGLSKIVSRNSISGQGIKGIIKFMDPIIINEFDGEFGDMYTYSSDIYSLGFIMWDISGNGQMLKNENGQVEIIKKLRGIQEKPVPGSTLSYIELYEKCWDKSPENRPNINQVCELIDKEDIINGKEWKETNE
ncbi:5573_t:CDS:2, partial [Scutellospora calospora]